MELTAVSRHFSDGLVRAVDGVDLEIESGSWVTITGPSGSGKSTLLSLISGLDLPTSGEVRFRGRSMNSLREWTRVRQACIGLVFQAFHLVPTLTAAENVELPMFGNGFKQALRRQLAHQLLDRVGMSHVAQRSPGELSGGELQRVAIARALVNSPHLILADEPTGNLDSRNSEQIIGLLKELYFEQDCTVVMVTHDPVISRWGDHRVCMRDGKMSAQIHCSLDDPCTL
ncbi:MAG: ABC transporter ATP-binding protein [Desulfarculaceae bacterium]|nr:ABC transporter ATP-binding protein [Desulfarculaceae bacterium]MCF8074508.1 ABC transporter ATP-binding protein [Desulfarculaceae bacterium]MCF8103580.1 ABC transporter ATP-binding protein [Desulfarculaceae bacterium]MCF8118370.1 ABC transporter ATP-binding protein [Desulfarculaceae bacterium]